MAGNATLGSPRDPSPFCEIPRHNSTGSPPACSSQHAGWGPLLISSPTSMSTCQGDSVKHFPIPRARRCSSPPDRVSSPTQHARPVSGQVLSSCQINCQERNRRGSFSDDDARFPFARGFGRHLGHRDEIRRRLEGQSGEATVRQPGTREPSPTRVPSTKHTKLTHIICCRSGTF